MDYQLIGRRTNRRRLIYCHLYRESMENKYFKYLNFIMMYYISNITVLKIFSYLK